MVTAPLELRIQRILKSYECITEEFFISCMEHIRPYIKKSSLQDALEAFRINDLYKVAEILLVDYYDTVYHKPEKIDFTLHVKDIDTALNTLEEFKKSL